MTTIPEALEAAQGWEARYVDGDIPWDTGRPDPYLMALIERSEARVGRALDVGCGTGHNVLFLARRGFDALGIDLSVTAIEAARALATAEDVSCRFEVANLLYDDVQPGPYSLVYDRGCFHLFDDEDRRSRFVRRVAELLAPGGIWHSLLGSTDGPPRDTGPPRRSATEIISALEGCFEILELRAVPFDEDQHASARAWTLTARRRESMR